MRLYGYAEDSGEDDETPTRLGEVTLCADPDLLRKLSKFLLLVADEMEKHGQNFGHEHFEDHDEPTAPRPSFIVARENSTGP